jgi:hypothetical protein
MEIKRENRPVSMTTGPSGLLPLDLRLPCTRSARPCARDPPLLRRRSYRPYTAGACSGQTRQGRPPN